MLFRPRWKTLALVILLAPAILQAAGSLERQLQQIIVPKAELKEVTLDAALDFMAQIPVKNGQLSSPVNMVKAYKTVNPALDDTIITLSLTNIPWTDLMRYICETANVQCDYETNAVIIRAPAKSSPTP